MAVKKANNAPKRKASAKAAPKTRLPQKTDGDIPLESVSDRKMLAIGLIILIAIIAILIFSIQTGYIHMVDDVNKSSTPTTTTIRDDRLDYDEEGNPHFKRAGT